MTSGPIWNNGENKKGSGLFNCVSETVIPTKLTDYDAEGRLAGIRLPLVADPNDNNVLKRPRYQYQYDERGNQTAIIDPLNQTTTFTFTSRGQQESRTLPLGFTESFTYDDQGRQLTHTSFEGVVTENEYDATGRLSKMRYSRNGTLLETREFAFDEYGRNVGNVLKDAAGTVTRIEETIFDSRGRILFEKSPEGILGYGYDNAGRMSYTAVFGGVGFQPENPPSLTDAIRVTHYGYDILSRLISVQEDITPAITTDATQDTAYTFDLQGRMVRTTISSLAPAGGEGQGGLMKRAAVWQFG